MLFAVGPHLAATAAGGGGVPITPLAGGGAIPACAALTGAILSRGRGRGRAFSPVGVGADAGILGRLQFRSSSVVP